MGTEFSWWQHGGEPGPDWSSGKLDLTSRAGEFTALYTRARADQAAPFMVGAQAFSESRLQKTLYAVDLGELGDFTNACAAVARYLRDHGARQTLPPLTTPWGSTTRR